MCWPGRRPIFLSADRLAFFPAGSLSLRFPLRSFAFRLALSLFLGFTFRLTLRFPLGLFLGFALRLTLGLTLRLTLGLFLGFALRLAFGLFLGFALRLAFRLALSLFLGFLLGLAFGYFLFRLTLGLLLYCPFLLLSYATSFRRSFLPRYFPLLRDLALRSFFP